MLTTAKITGPLIHQDRKPIGEKNSAPQWGHLTGHIGEDRPTRQGDRLLLRQAGQVSIRSYVGLSRAWKA
jgi:hypothetical protein